MHHRHSLFIAVFFIIAFTGSFGTGSVLASENNLPLKAIKNSTHEVVADYEYRIPSFISISTKPSLPSLIAGEIDSFQLEIKLDASQNYNGEKLSWDYSSANPVIAWLSIPQKCGITFIDRKMKDRSGHQTLVRFNLPKDSNSNIFSSYILYSADTRIKTGKYSIVLDVVAELITENGSKIQDVGIIDIPVRIDTHLWTKLLMLFVIAVVIFLFVVEWVRVDVVAIMMMILLPELGLLGAGDAFRGLSSNAVISIIGVMIISFGLNRTGLVNMIIQPLIKFVKGGESRLVIIFSSLIATISSVMQNTGAAVLFLPAIRLITSRELKIHISRVLMPIGMAAILGGTLTMIGTSPLILLNDILPKGMPKFGLLELTPIGIALVVGGIVYLSTIGMKILSKLPLNQESSDSDINDESMLQQGGVCCYPNISGPYEIWVPISYQPKNKIQDIASILREYQVSIVAVVTYESDFVDIAPRPRMNLQSMMGFCAYGQKEKIENFVKDYNLILKEKPIVFKKTMFDPAYAGIVEMVVAPRSRFIGKRIKDIGFRETFKLNPLALHQNEKIHYRDLAERSLNSGDAILVHGTWEQIQSLRDQHQHFIIISSFKKYTQKPEKAKYALISFLTALLLMVISSFYLQNLSYNPLPLSICLMIGAIGMIIMKVMTISEAYKAIDTRTVFLLGGLIPLGMAVDQTGTAAWLAKGIVFGLQGFMSPLVLILVLAVLSCLFTMVISNVGSCALLVPLGVSIANQLGVDPRVAVIVVGLGVSNSFILPTHQVNALYMGPGEYRSKDYIKIGGGLSIVYILILSAMTYFFYL